MQFTALRFWSRITLHRQSPRLLPSSRQLTSTVTNNTDYDIVIVGGGMVGGALACALATSPLTSTLNVAIIEASAAPPLPPSLATSSVPDLRMVALAPSSIRLLQAVDVWTQRLQHASTPYHKMVVWDSDEHFRGKGASHSTLEWDAYHCGSDVLGYIVSVNQLQQSLLQKIESLPSIHLYSSTTMKDVQLPDVVSGDDHVRLTIATAEGTRGLQCRLLVAADGWSSLTRQISGISSWTIEYGESGVVAALSLAPPSPPDSHTSPALYQPSTHNYTCYQKFLSDGSVIAMLPAGPTHVSLVWSVPTAAAQRLCALPATHFVDEVNKAMGGSPIVTTASSDGPSSAPFIWSVASPRASFPLKLSSATAYASHRVALVGDAAHTVHPFVGQGVNIGFTDVTILTKQLIQTMETGGDIGSATSLSSYSQQRVLVNGALLSGMHAMKTAFGVGRGRGDLQGSHTSSTLFGSLWTPLEIGFKYARHLGLSLLNCNDMMKRSLAAVAMGDYVTTDRIGQNKAP